MPAQALISGLCRIERVMRQDEERPLVRPAEQDLQRTVRHVDPPRFLAIGTIDEDLSIEGILKLQ